MDYRLASAEGYEEAGEEEGVEMENDKLIEWLAKPFDFDKVGLLMHESWCKTKREQGFHGPDEKCTSPFKLFCEDSWVIERVKSDKTRCNYFHPNLISWGDLPEKRKDINRHAFDAVLPYFQQHSTEQLALQQEANAELLGAVVMRCRGLATLDAALDGKDRLLSSREMGELLTRIQDKIRNSSPDLEAARRSIEREAIESVKCLCPSIKLPTGARMALCPRCQRLNELEAE